jgi:hypothetical protein
VAWRERRAECRAYLCDVRTNFANRRGLKMAIRRLDLPTMIKGTTNSASGMAFVVLALGCGGRAENQVSAGVGGGEAAGGAPTIDINIPAGSTSGIGPIDATGLPAELPMHCPGLTSPPQLACCHAKSEVRSYRQWQTGRGVLTSSNASI